MSLLTAVLICLLSLYFFKVLVAYPSAMKCLETQCKGLQATIVQRAREKNYRSILFALVNSTETESIAREVFQTKISSECKQFAKKKSSINTNDPVLISEFRNIRFVKEVEENTPYLYSALQGGVKDATNFNQIALGAAACMSTRTKSSAFLIRNSIILQHGGCKAQDMSRLNKLGICSSHSTSIRAQTRMGEGFDDDVLEWKQDIETSKKKVLLLEEVKEIQIPVFNEDDMEVEVHVDFTKDTVSSYKHYSETIFQECQELLLTMCEELRSDLNQDVLEKSLHHLKSEELPTYRSDILVLITYICFLSNISNTIIFTMNIDAEKRRFDVYYFYYIDNFFLKCYFYLPPIIRNVI